MGYKSVFADQGRLVRGAQIFQIPQNSLKYALKLQLL